MIKKLNNDHRGSLTVEAALIVPVMLLCVVAVIYICILLYQQVYVQSLASDAAERGAAVWTNPSKDMFMEQIKKEQMKQTSLYWRLFESDSKKEEKRKRIKEYVNYQIQKYSILGRNNSDNKNNQLNFDNVKVECKTEDWIVYKKLVVSIDHKYPMPFGKMLSNFGIDANYTVTGKAEVVINEPTEFIRNTDFLLDTVQEIDNKTGNNLQNLRDKVGGLVSKFAGKIKEFLE
ncbi:MAG: pilus assembly protein [Clostridia bacterium]|nr:pilus assembly protein [Clostridia bacterium]